MIVGSGGVAGETSGLGASLSSGSLSSSFNKRSECKKRECHDRYLVYGSSLILFFIFFVLFFDPVCFLFFFGIVFGTWFLGTQFEFGDFECGAGELDNSLHARGSVNVSMLTERSLATV